MKLLLPNNIYAGLFASLLPGITQDDIAYAGSALISKDLDEGKADVALIPSMDVLNHPQFFISGKTAVSFDGPLSNSYFYFIKQIRMVKEVHLRGDVSKNEVILSKIIFAEQFDLNVEVFLDSKPFVINTKNYLVCGDDNNMNSLYESGLSLADQVSDLLEAPYVNYVLASKDENVLKNFTSGLSSLDKAFEDNFDNVAPQLNASADMIANLRQNINAVYFDMTEVEKKSLADLIRLPYFTGLIENIEEIKLID